jgi:translation initiation factor 3 subunit C
MTDSHTTEYISRLREEPILLALAEKVSAYLRRINDHSSCAFIALRQAEHFYYKTESVYVAMRNLVERTKAQEAAAAASPPAATAQVGENGAAVASSAAADSEVAATEEEKFESLIQLPLPQDFSLPDDCHGLMKDLVDTIYVHGDERSKARAVLVHIYHKSIHGQFHSARDGLLMSHLQEQVMSMDVSTMILYNRSMAQLGLCAFRCGLILECHSCLAELYGSNKIRELLAQGMSLNRCEPQPIA